MSNSYTIDYDTFDPSMVVFGKIETTPANGQTPMSKSYKVGMRMKDGSVRDGLYFNIPKMPMPLGVTTGYMNKGFSAPFSLDVNAEGCNPVKIQKFIDFLGKLDKALFDFAVANGAEFWPKVKADVRPSIAGQVQNRLNKFDEETERKHPPMFSMKIGQNVRKNNEFFISSGIEYDAPDQDGGLHDWDGSDMVSTTTAATTKRRRRVCRMKLIPVFPEDADKDIDGLRQAGRRPPDPSLYEAMLLDPDAKIITKAIPPHSLCQGKAVIKTGYFANDKFGYRVYANGIRVDKFGTQTDNDVSAYDTDDEDVVNPPPTRPAATTSETVRPTLQNNSDDEADAEGEGEGEAEDEDDDASSAAAPDMGAGFPGASTTTTTTAAVRKTTPTGGAARGTKRK